MRKEYFPDGTIIEEWFHDFKKHDINKLGKKYLITEFGIKDDGRIYTEEFQKLIDTIYDNGGGVIIVPNGIYMTGALHFKQGVNLYIQRGGVLKGSDDISDYPPCITRIEGETCMYFPALINADNIDGFTICGEGVIDGNGLKSWKAFWLRRTWNPNCTNKDEQRPRLIYISNSSNILISGLVLQNSHFWTSHYYKCKYIKIIDCGIFSPIKPIGAPSTDAIDIDACSDVLVKKCRFQVNDDAIALKGGKGPFANDMEENGSNERIIIEDCEYGTCHSCLTCGSESIHNRNIILRNIKTTDAYHMLCLKMRPDTPQLYEFLTIDNVEGHVTNFININAWNQFFDLKGMESIPVSKAEKIFINNCNIECNKYFDVTPRDEQYILSDFVFKNLKIKTKIDGYSDNIVKNIIIKDVIIELIK